MKELLYRFIAAAFQAFLWGGEVAGQENLPEQGPAVLVANHHGALGPIACAASIPVRLYPWIAADVLDLVRAPEYLRWDFVERELHLRPPASLWLARAIAKISVPLLNSLGCIAVYPDTERLHFTFEHSVDLLVQGKFVLVFPEDPNQPLDPALTMTPFRKGFVRLGELYYQRTKKALRFYPVAVRGECRYVQIGRPITFNPFSSPVEERLRVKRILEAIIHEMYLGMTDGAYLGVPLPH